MRKILYFPLLILPITNFLCLGQKMTPKIRSKILHGHNIRRARDYLEKSAKSWAKKCQSLKHSNGNHGENLYMVWPAFSLEKVALKALEAWWDFELHNLTMPIPKRLDKKLFEHSGAGHFTQMSTDLIRSVGCAGSKCPGDRLLFVCHYDKR
uniref:SCP domain-containing protein n=1 Tax=Ditylenchus dipsaci TaxID=166011 RepID=A0A915EGP8_9BILA